MANLKSCPFCGADYDDMLPKCPYCQSTNYKGAEAEYLNKLEDVRSDMEELGGVAEQERKKEWKKSLKYLFILLGVSATVVIVLIIYGWWDNREVRKDPQEEYLWVKTNYPIMDELYENGEYDKLLEMYADASKEDWPVLDWEHAYFVETLDELEWVETLLEDLEAGEELSDYNYEDLVYYGWKFEGPYLEKNLTEEERQIVAPRVESYLEDFHTRWKFTEKDRTQFEKYMSENSGYPSFDLCQAYIDKWKKENRKK